MTIRRLHEGDAAALAECFTRCYGPSYVVAEFYDPAATAERIRSGTLRSVVAVSRGEIVGHMGLVIRDPRAETVDAGNSIVDPAYRGHHLVARLAAGVIELCREGGFLGFHHYPTTVHPIMQKLALAGGTETGIMLDYIPSGTEYREIEGSPRRDRPAVVVVYHPLRSAPAREVFAPQPLAPVIEEIYARAKLQRAVRCTDAPLPPLPTALTTASNPRRGLFRVEVGRIGADLPDAVRVAIDGVDVPVLQIDLPMADPAVPRACDALGSSGFFFSAVIPEYLDGDVLRLQRLRGESAVPNLVSDEAKRIFQMIREAQRKTLER